MEARSLGKFYPTRLDRATIEREMRQLLPPCCQKGPLGTRVPGEIPCPENLQWHRDGAGSPPHEVPKHLVLWANVAPTEVKTNEGQILPFEAYDLIWIDNEHAWHRQPNINTNDRWFAAVPCWG